MQCDACDSHKSINQSRPLRPRNGCIRRVARRQPGSTSPPCRGFGVGGWARNRAVIRTEKPGIAGLAPLTRRLNFPKINKIYFRHFYRIFNAGPSLSPALLSIALYYTVVANPSFTRLPGLLFLPGGHSFPKINEIYFRHFYRFLMWAPTYPPHCYKKVLCQTVVAKTVFIQLP